MQTSRRRGPEPQVAQEALNLRGVAYALNNVAEPRWPQPEVKYVGVRWLPLIFSPGDVMPWRWRFVGRSGRNFSEKTSVDSRISILWLESGPRTKDVSFVGRKGLDKGRRT